MRRLYEHVENIINSIDDSYKDRISYQGMREDEPDRIGIFLYSSRDDEECLSGELMWECMKLQLQVTCKENEDDVFIKMNLIRKIVDSFVDCVSTVEGLDILWAKSLGGKVHPPFKNGYNLQVCKCVIDFNYSLKED